MLIFDMNPLCWNVCIESEETLSKQSEDHKTSSIWHESLQGNLSKYQWELSSRFPVTSRSTTWASQECKPSAKLIIFGICFWSMKCNKITTCHMPI